MIPHVEELEPRCLLDAQATGAFSAAIMANGNVLLYSLYSDAAVGVRPGANGQWTGPEQFMPIPVDPNYLATIVTADVGGGPQQSLAPIANIVADDITGKATISWHEGLKTFELLVDGNTMTVGPVRLVMDAAAIPPPPSVDSAIVLAVQPSIPLLQLPSSSWQGTIPPVQTPILLFVESVQLENGTRYVAIVRSDDFGQTLGDLQWEEFDKFWSAWPNYNGVL